VKSDGAYKTLWLKFSVAKNRIIKRHGNSIKNHTYIYCGSGDSIGKTAVPLTSARPAKIAIIVSGFFTCEGDFIIISLV
jgi:hypothetical protein